MEALARHEAAHVIASHFHGVEVFSVELSLSGDGVVVHDSPQTLLDAGHDALSVAIIHGTIAAAGAVAAPDIGFSANDHDGIRMAHWLCGLSDVSLLAFQNVCSELAGELLAGHQDELERVAAALRRHGALIGDEVKELLG